MIGSMGTSEAIRMVVTCRNWSINQEKYGEIMKQITIILHKSSDFMTQVILHPTKVLNHPQPQPSINIPWHSFTCHGWVPVPISVSRWWFRCCNGVPPRGSSPSRAKILPLLHMEGYKTGLTHQNLREVFNGF
jgi:hypothetical protein